MSNWLISSIQQYTIDRIRVSFSTGYLTDNIKNLSLKVYDNDNNDKSDMFKSIADSNEWEINSEVDVCDVVLNKNTNLTAGIYTFKLFENENLVYSSDVQINYMEDIRTKFKSIEPLSLDTILIKFESLYEDNIFQSREMLSLLNFSCIDDSGVAYGDVFESFSSVINNLPPDEGDITEVVLHLKSGKVLPRNYYTVRLTTRYKSRTFSILKDECKMIFMTTTPPSISSCYITKKSNNDVVLSVTFGSFIEKGMLEEATRKIIRSDGKNVSSYFSADRISTTSLSTAGVSYIVKLDIPLVTEYYVLQKDTYEICYSWDCDYIDDISCMLNTDWCLKDISNVELFEIEYMTMRFPDLIYNDEASKLKYDIEINGEMVTDPEIINNFSDILLNKPEGEIVVHDDAEQIVSKFYIAIKDKRKLTAGNYSFILYRLDENNEKDYRYIGHINFEDYLCPTVTSIYQSDIDKLTVTLEQPTPIDVLEFCKMTLYDEYGHIDFSSRLQSIHDSNIWEPGQTTASVFDVMISNDYNLSSGKYNSTMKFGGRESSKFAVSISYMESRRGFIKSVTQTSLSDIKIEFSELQTRKFLLSTKLMVERKNDGADYTDRFELLENVIKADQYIISELTIPMDHEDSLPAGRYTVSFIWENGSSDYVTVYSFDVELGYMTSCPPEISTVSTFIDSDGLLNVRVQFSSYLEMDLFNNAVVSILDGDNRDIISKMNDKESWTLVTTSRKEIVTIKNITMKALNTDFTFEKDDYSVIFSWDGIIKYMDDISGIADIDYILPLTKLNEVVALNPEARTGRMYFEFDKVLQWAFFENLKVEVFDEYGEDHTSMFDTIQHSNNIGPDTPESERIPTNNINLDILNISNLSFGTYTFIFYHEENKVRTSEYKALIDIMSAISPSIKSMEQVGIDTILVNLKSSMPRMLVEADTFKFISFKKFDYTTYFKSIDQSNNWDEDLREISSFYIKLKNGYKIGKGSYSFTMYAGSMKLDQCDIEIDYMEGADLSIDSVDIVNLNTLDILFSDEQSTMLFKTLTLQVIDEDGTDVSYKFDTIENAIKTVDTDFFESISIKITDGSSVRKGEYTFNIIKENNESEDTVLMSEVISLKYMSSEYPLLYDVSATKLDNGKDGIIMWFSPGLELDLFNNAGFTFNNLSGMSVLDKFQDIHDATLDTTEVDGITYVKFATIEFNEEKTLNKDKYIVGFNWLGEYAFMKNLSCEVSLDYILFPVKSIELVSSNSVEVTFNKYLKNSYLRETELVVDSLFKTTNDDGTIVTEVDFTDQFKSLTESNDFDNLPDDINKIIINLKDGVTLPEATYRFIIAEKIVGDDDGGSVLQYAYAGSIDIEILISDDILKSNIEVSQVSYDTLKIKFEKPQNIKFLNRCEFNFVKDATPTSAKIDLTSMFKSIKMSNRYEVKDDDGKVIEYKYYVSEMDRDNIIDEIHYNIAEVNFIYMKIDNHCAIPSGSYTLYFTNSNIKYFESVIDTTFMTTDAPLISNMEIVDDKLSVTFSPKPEIETLYQSKYSIMTNRGFDENGQILGTDVTEYFDSILMSDITKEDTDIGITYVSKIDIPISPEAIIASGKYKLDWMWNEKSFFPVSTYNGALNVYTKGIKSALVHNFNTIKVILQNEYKWSYISSLEVSVTTSDESDCSELFKSIIDSNPEIDPETKVSEFFIMVDEDEEVISDTYTFSLTYNVESEEGDDTETTAFLFKMNIVYLADEFPVIEYIDNISSQRYNITLLNNATASEYMGKYVQIEGSDKVLLTKSNLSDYLGKYVKVFGDATIDTLSIKFVNAVNPCLLNALTHSIIDSDGNDISDYFNPINSTNRFPSRKILDYVKFTFNRRILAEEINGYEFSIITGDGRDISDKFDNFDKSNPDVDYDDYISSFMLQVEDDEYIEEYDLANLKIEIYTTDEESGMDDIRVFGYTYNLFYKSTSNTDMVDMKLKSGKTLIPSIYDITFTYQNEPTIEDSVVITPFAYSGELPFLSTSIGRIDAINIIDISHLNIKFSEDLPITIFEDMVLHVYDSDRIDHGDKFVELSASNDFIQYEYLSNLPDPFTISLALDEGQSLMSGSYTFEFEMKISVVEDEESDEDVNADFYKLWSYTAKLNYLSNEKPNSITTIDQVGINRLKISLENPIDVSLLKTFKVSLENESNGFNYDSDTFIKLSESNNFGKYVLLTDSKYILYSEDGLSWLRFDTGKSYSFNDIYFDKELSLYIVICSGGKVLTFNKFEKSSIVEHNTPTTKNLTSIIKTKGYYLISGNDGVILRGSIVNNSFVSVLCTTNVNKTITKLASKSDDFIVAVGYSGTILYSDNAGLTWTKVPVAVSSPLPNLTDVIYFDKYTSEDGEELDANNPGFYVTGTNGTLLYSKDGDNLYTKITLGTPKSLYSIAQHGGIVLAVGDSGVIYRSTDTEEWESIESDASYSLKRINWCDSKFIICGPSGKWLTSTFGEYWTQSSTIHGDSFKNVKFMDSQYDDNRKLSYFYLELARNKYIGTVGFYTGTEIPTLTNYPAKTWINGETKRTHVGDIYTVFEGENSSIITGEYQFVANVVYDPNSDDEATTFEWKDCTFESVDKRFSGNYTFYINLNDDTMSQWTQKNNVSLTYLTDNPGEITGVSLINPTSVVDKDHEYTDPYLKINMDRGDEEAIYYASYELIAESGESYTNRFVSLHAADLTYRSSKINGINIPNAKDMGYPDPGNYTFKWYWTPWEHIDIPLSIKPIKNLFKSIERTPEPNELEIIFREGIPSEYFYKKSTSSGTNISKAKICIYKYIGDTLDTSVNYFEWFKPIESTTSFSSEKVYSIKLIIEDGFVLPPNEYSIIISNTDETVNLDTIYPDYTHVLSGQITLDQELTGVLPSLVAAKVMNYISVVESPISGKILMKYTGVVDPDQNPEMITLLQNWKYIGEDELDYHIGDIYTNTTTNQKFNFNKNKITGVYFWEPEVSNPSLCVIFNDKPIKATAINYINSVKLTQCDESGNPISDVTSYIDKNIYNWDFESYTSGDVRYLSKIIMKVNKNQTFYGASNVTMELDWKPGCIYNTVSDTEINLPAQMATYGKIKMINATVIPTVNSTSFDAYGNVTNKDDSSNTGLEIEFTQPVFTSMLSKASFEITYIGGSYGVIGDDYSDEFLTLKDSNSVLFSENETVDKIYAQLYPNTAIPSGLYKVTITCPKIPSTGNADDEVVFTGNTQELPWMTSSPPSDISVSFKKHTGYSYPTLDITFVDNMPALSSCKNKSGAFSISVFRQDLDGKNNSINFGFSFEDPKTSKKIEYHCSKEEPELVEYIRIPLKSKGYLPKGTFDVRFKFPTDTLMESLPAIKGVHRTFTNSNGILANIGKVTGISTNSNNQKLTIKTDIKLPGITAYIISKYLNIKTTAALRKKLKIKIVNSDGKDVTSMVKSKPVISGNKYIYTIKDNKRIDPGKLTVSYLYGGSLALSAKTITNFKGLLKNVAGKGKSDKICYILTEKHGGVSRIKIYSSYKKLEARINKMKKLNKNDKTQLAKCKKCRAKRFILSKSISTTFDKYNFPNGNRVKFIDPGIKDVVKYSGKKAGCKKCKMIKHVSKSKGYTSYQCEHYVNSKTQYTWDIIIANIPKGSKYKNKMKAYIAYLRVKDVKLYRVFPSTSKGKKTSKYKKYIKTLKKYIKSYNSAVGKCQKCKKREIADKGNKSLTWTSAMFNNYMMTNKKTNKKVIKKVNTAFKNKKLGCSKAKFKFVEANSKYCKLSCSNSKSKDTSLKYGTSRGTFVK